MDVSLMTTTVNYMKKKEPRASLLLLLEIGQVQMEVSEEVTRVRDTSEEILHSANTTLTS